MKNFDLEAAKRGAAVCTRGGLPVEFSHITNSAYLPVRVLVYGDPKKLYSEIGAYLENGQMYPDIASEDDLMMRDDDYLEKLERGEYDHIAGARKMVGTAIKQNLNTDREYWRRVCRAGDAKRNIRMFGSRQWFRWRQGYSGNHCEKLRHDCRRSD